MLDSALHQVATWVSGSFAEGFSLLTSQVLVHRVGVDGHVERAAVVGNGSGLGRGTRGGGDGDEGSGETHGGGSGGNGC